MTDLEDRLRGTYRDVDAADLDTGAMLAQTRHGIRRRRRRVRVTASLASAGVVAAVIATVHVTTAAGGGSGIDHDAAPPAQPRPVACAIDRATPAVHPSIATGWLPSTFSWSGGSRIVGCDSANDLYVDAAGARSISITHGTSPEDTLPRARVSFAGKPALVTKGLPVTAYELLFRRQDGIWVTVQVDLTTSDNPRAIAEHVARTLPDTRQR